MAGSSIKQETRQSDLTCLSSTYPLTVRKGVYLINTDHNTIESYSFEDLDGTPDTFSTYSLAEAREYAGHWRKRLVARIYQYVASDVIDDYTSNEVSEEF